MRKTNGFMALALVSAIIVSCAKENISKVDLSEGFNTVEFNAVPEMTKTAISGEGQDKTVTWVKDDQIKIFYTGGSATAVAKADGETTSFSAEVPQGDEYYAVYPSSAADFAEGAYAVTVPAVQNGAFATGNVSVARLFEDKASTFYNVTAFVKVVVNDAEYTKVTVKAVGGESIAGKMAVTLDSEYRPVIGEISEGVSEITLNVSAPGTYYVALVPDVQLTKGLLAQYYKGSSQAGAYFLDREITVGRSKIASVGALEERIGKFYVSVSGAGAKTGKDWTNALDAAGFKDLIGFRGEDTEAMAAQAAMLDGSTIYFAEGTFDFGDLVDISFGESTSPVELSFVGTVDTEGAPVSVITGGDTHRLLTLDASVKASFQNMAFVHSLATVSSEPALVFMENSTVSMKNCAVTDNRNWNGEKFSTAAGVVAKAGVDLTIDGCEFARNEASWGASLSLKGGADIKNSSFHNNTGTNGPGNSVYMDSTDGVLDIINCTFKDNTCSATHGGAVSATGGVMNIRECVFENNAQADKYGAAIRLWNAAKATLTDCTVKGNHSNYGGAFFLENTSMMICDGGLYEGNYAKGGGLVNVSGSSSFKVCGNAVVKGNYATAGHGGAILFGSTDGVLTCENVTFENNYNNSSSGAWGGAIGSTAETGKVVVSNCTFKGNHSKYFGGAAINLQASVNMELSNSKFEGNYNEATGISSSNNNGNYAGGAMRLNTKGTVDVKGCTFTGNYVKQSTNYDHSYAGAVYINTGGVFRFDGCVFDGNYATRGGALCAWATGSKVYLNACAFTKNWISHRYGTTIHIEKAGEFCMNNCSIADDTYTVNGTGAFQSCWLNLSTITDGVLISNCSFIGSPREGADKAIASGDNSSIIRYDALESDNNYLVNNIIVTESTAGTNKTMANYNKKITLVYTKRSDNVANGAGGSQSAIESPASNGFANTSEYFGGLNWNSDNMYWAWNGTIAKGNNTTKCPVETAVEYIGKVAGFKTWLTTIGALYKDQLGNARNTSGTWWPGAYDGTNN